MTDFTPDHPASPPLTAVVVVRNDAQTLAETLDSLAAQHYESGIDIVVAIAPNTDGTGEVLARAARENPRLSVIEYSSASPAVGLNEAIAAARTSLVLRVDPRASLPPDFATAAVAAMARTDAAALVARSTPVGETHFEHAVAQAFENSAGLGRDPLALPRREQQVQSAVAHVIKRRTFIEVGLYDEEIRHGQGWEMNERLREHGHTVWFTPELQTEYRPPSRVVNLTRSQFAEGLWRGEFARAYPAEKVLRFVWPPIVVIATIGGFILGAVGFFGVIAGALGVAAVISYILFALLVIPAVYVLGVIVLSLAVMSRSSLRVGLWFVLVLPLIHFSWGFGFIAGFVNLEGAADTVIVDFD